MSELSMTRRAIRFMFRNGYSKPEPDGSEIRGPLKSLYYLPNKIWRVIVVLKGLYFDRKFDRQHNVKTSGAIYLRELEIDSDSVECGELYDAFPYRSFKHIAKFLPPDVSDYTFVDFGSGMGRVFFMASDYGFKKIIGVEFSKQLHDIAAENIQTYRSSTQRCADIEAVHSDATQFRIPDGKCVLFMFSPFRGKVRDAVFENIRQSYREDPRHILILFTTGSGTHPVPWNSFAELEFLRKVSSGGFPFDPAKRYPIEYAVFESNEHSTRISS